MLVSTKTRRMITRAISSIIPSCRKFSKLLECFCDEYEGVAENTKTAFKALFLQTRIMPMFYSNTPALLDEGFVQLLTSVPHDEQLKKSKAYIELVDFLKKYNDIYVVDCLCDTDICVQRLRKRNSGDRFNAVKDDIIIRQLLDTKRANLTAALEDFVCICNVRTDSDGQTEKLENAINEVAL